jgi:Double zinc ribbon
MPDTCTKCSASLDEDAIFCPSCAAPVNPQCPSCGKSVSADAKFCKYCACDLTQKVSAATEQTPPPQQQVKSGIDALLADKYHAMSNAQLLAMLKGDLSGQTEKTLSIALAELETRTNIDWRDMAVAKTRVKEAIIAAHAHGSIGSLANTPRHSASQDLEREKAERLAKAGGITAGISALLFLWGYSYTNSFANAARAGLMNLAGQTDSTYAFAQFCVTFGAIGFIVGVVLLIVGMTRR